MNKAVSFFFVFGSAVLIFARTTSAKMDFEMVTRSEWQARPPKMIENMRNPVPYVIIHHSAIPKACSTTQKCIRSVKSMQNYHMDTQQWDDIGYSFLVGGDGKVYEGTGWSAVGAHAPGYNSRSLGICLIGDWTDEIPPRNQLEATKKLIQYGVDTGKIDGNYKLLGHRQVRATACPGNALFNEIQTWSHFSRTP